MTYKIVIYGAPGTGKTTYLIDLIKKELEKNNIEDISYLTFTKKAAEDAKLKISNAAKLTLKEIKHFGTIHSACFALLKCNKGKVIGRSSKHFAEFCIKYGYSFARSIFNEEELVGDITNVTEFGNILLDMYNRARIFYPLREDKFKHFHDKYKSEYYEYVPFKELLRFIERWKDYKSSNGLIDFVDMLELVLENQIKYKPKIQFYDEQQDVSPLLYEVYKHFSSFADRVYVCADPNQSIFSFMGTKPELFLEDDFNESIVLPKTHRLPNKIWDYSKRFILKSKSRYYDLDKVAPFADGGTIKKRNSFETYYFNEFTGDTYILCRIWQFLNNYRDELIDNSIPFTMGRGNVWTDKLININNGIVKLLKGSLRLSYEEVKDILTSINSRYLSINVKEFFGKKRSNRKFSSDEFFSFFNGYSSSVIFKIQNCLTLPDLKKKALLNYLHKGKLIKEIKVYLGTIHSVKGLEADNVFLDNTITLKISERIESLKHYEEEMRVFYVGMTRAKRNLILLDTPYSGFSFPINL